MDVLVVGTSFSEALAAYGAPTRTEPFVTDVYCGVFYFHDSLGLAGLVEDDCDGLLDPDEVIRTLYARAPYPGTTAGGVGVGSPLADVWSVFGAPDEIAAPHYWYNRLGIVFALDDDQLVAEIAVFSPAL